jgi:hypothetical protein
MKRPSTRPSHFDIIQSAPQPLIKAKRKAADELSDERPVKKPSIEAAYCGQSSTPVNVICGAYVRILMDSSDPSNNALLHLHLCQYSEHYHFTVNLIRFLGIPGNTLLFDISTASA